MAAPETPSPPNEPTEEDPEKAKPAPEDFVYYRESEDEAEWDRRWGAEESHSWGDVDEQHWSKTRGDRNDEVLDYYRRRSKAPGVAEGGASRNQYCMECDGVIPLSYSQMEPAQKKKQNCPHCGATLEGRIHRMFNWVEIDQPHEGDVRAFLPFLIGGGLLLAAGVWFLFFR